MIRTFQNLRALVRQMKAIQGERKAKHRLHALDDHALKDIGLSRCDIERAARYARNGWWWP